MLKSLFSGAFKSPVKFLALCLAVYIAAHSIIVALLMAGAAYNHFKNGAKKASHQPERDSADRHDADESPRHANRSAVAPVHSDGKAPVAPQRQYAKSAVVIPIKASSNQTNAHHLKTGTK
ncbi:MULTISPECIES: hypothetical protein [Burkholderia]|uniref:Uncharacterized protein n=1 Tax=Burkholderia latens TaxID=488446 RepID=A0A6H9SXL7_9BURK|nr:MULTISPECIES: hypothetical protein [Burkholderia]AMU19243.1 hypothetical protein A3203_39125 [Burkholderia cenocepacia]KAB0644626.1 hypothetical protein F7R21_02175 [Burkholderia latens]MBG0880395.1 hypothetical protein [Burkholderia sp. 9775_39]MBG0886220.1 hypothetical protein [Burkholderia sp. 9773_38]MBJ9925091.1 hypothetical protein [Burkholderia cenocepacia]